MDCTLLGLLVVSGMYIAKMANMVIIKSIENSAYLNKEVMINITEYLPYIAIILFIITLKSLLFFFKINFKLKKQDLDNTLSVFTDCSIEENEFGVSIIRSKGTVCGAFVSENETLNVKADLGFYFRVQRVFFYSIFMGNMNTKGYHFASMMTAFILLYTIKFLFINDIPHLNVGAEGIKVSVYVASICAAILFGINIIIRNVYCRISNIYWFLVFFVLCDDFMKCLFWIVIARFDRTSLISFGTDMPRIHHPSKLATL